MAEELIKTLLTPASQVALIIGLAELIKRIGLPSKWIPLVDLGLGLVSGILLYGLFLGYGIPNGIVIGVAIGLSSCGLFSGVKNVIQKESEGNENGGIDRTGGE